MSSALFSVNSYVEKHAVLSRLLSSLSCDTVGYMNRIRFASDILTDYYRNNGEQGYCYKLVEYTNKGLFGIFNDISDHVTLVQLKYSDDNINRIVSITECWI